MTIPNNIRALREERGISQVRLAEMLNIKSSTDRISYWERGYMYPHLKNFLNMLKIFNCRAEDVYPDLENLPDGPKKKRKNIA